MEVLKSQVHKARKKYTCQSCGRKINSGDKYAKVNYRINYEFKQVELCKFCFNEVNKNVR